MGTGDERGGLEVISQKPNMLKNNGSVDQAKPREEMVELCEVFRNDPFRYLPERSISCVARFITGYDSYGVVLRFEIEAFKQWLIS